LPTLDWIGKEAVINHHNEVPFRLLEHDPKLSHGEPNTGNMLIEGDNLEALKALLPYYKGKVKCIYIDPPYNTGKEDWIYNDNVNSPQMKEWLGKVVDIDDLSRNDKWLCLMYPRLVLLRELLDQELGSVWISIDADESHYLKAVCDEIFGRQNFVDEVTWQRAFAPVNLKKTLSRNHDTILVYAKNAPTLELNKLPRSKSQLKNYKNPDNDPRGLWTSSDCTVGPVIQEKLYKIITPSGRIVTPPSGRCWLFTENRFEEMKSDGRIWFGKKGDNVPRVKKFLSEVKEGVTSMTMWLRDDVGDNQEAKREVKSINKTEVFDTPKPERLIQRILHIASNEGDLVMDSFLGSGTTSAVAHKMGRKYIGVEMEKHAETHCALRLKKVIKGEQGGISEAVNWEKGGGFDYYRLGETVFGPDGKIRETIKFKDLARHVFYSALNVPLDDDKKLGKSSLLGEHNGTAVYLLYNGILKDKSANGGNALTRKVLAKLPKHKGPKIIFGTSCRLSYETLRKNQITFKQIPYHIKVS